MEPVEKYPLFIETDAYLVINSQIYPLKNERTTIGRKLDNDLVIQDPLVSRRHAEIHQVGDTYKLIDLKSTSGTYINKFKVTECTLYSGDVILVANVPIMYINQGVSVSNEAKHPTSTLFGMIGIQDDTNTLSKYLGRK